MNILLLNAHSPQNAGDLAILKESLRYLECAFPGANTTVAINDSRDELLPAHARYVPSLTRWLVTLTLEGEWTWQKPLAVPVAAWLLFAALLYRCIGIRLWPRADGRRQLMRAYYDADVVVVIGGGHLYAPHAYNIAFIWLWVGLALAVVLGKPLLLLPQSFGPLPGRLQRAMLRWLLEHAAFVAAREYRSVELLAKLKLRRALVLPDLAFTAAEAAPHELDAAVPQIRQARASGRPLIGLTLMDWGGQNPRFRNQPGYEAAVLALIGHLAERYDARIFLFSQCFGSTAAHDDRRIARRLAAVAPPADLTVVDAALSPELLKAAYRQIDALVATRMHSAIFALGAGVPTLVIGYLHKSVGIMEMLGLERYCLDIDTVDCDTLRDGFDRLWRDRTHVARRIGERVPMMRSTLHHLPALLGRAVRDR